MPLQFIHEFRTLLSQWKLLEPAAQAELLSDIDALVSQEQQSDTIRSFVNLMAQRFPTVDGFLPFVAFLAVAVSGITLAVNFFDKGVLCASILTSLGLAIVLSLLVHRALRRRLHRNFFLKEFLPNAQDRGLDSAEILTYLTSIDPFSPCSRMTVPIGG